MIEENLIQSLKLINPKYYNVIGCLYKSYVDGLLSRREYKLELIKLEKVLKDTDQTKEIVQSLKFIL